MNVSQLFYCTTPCGNLHTFRGLPGCGVPPIYGAVNLVDAEYAKEEFREKWDKKYPNILKSWNKNWAELMSGPYLVVKRFGADHFFSREKLMLSGAANAAIDRPLLLAYLGYGPLHKSAAFLNLVGFATVLSICLIYPFSATGRIARRSDSFRVSQMNRGRCQCRIRNSLAFSQQRSGYQQRNPFGSPTRNGARSCRLGTLIWYRPQWSASIQKFCADAGYRGTFVSDVKEQLGLAVNISEKIKPH